MTAPLGIVITSEGLQALVDAEAGGTTAIIIAEMGLTDAAFLASPALAFLPGEFKRIAAVSGEAVDGATIHLIARDESDDSYAARGFAFYLADGSLFAVYGQAEPFVGKASVSTLLLALDVRFEAGQAPLVTFGDANFLYPPATTERKGVAEIASGPEVAAGVDAYRIVTPAQLASHYIPRTLRGAADGIASLDGAGKVPVSQLPVFDSVDRFVEDSEADMLALAASVGDFCIRTDLSKTYTLAALPASTLANWVEFLTPGAPVQSVNGKTGAVALLPADVGAVPVGRTVTGGGLARDGGNLDRNQVITVLKASAEEAATGLRDDVACTPASLVAILAALGEKITGTRRVNTSGLARGGKVLDSDVTIEVAAASLAAILAGVDDTLAVTPAGLAALPRSLGVSGWRQHLDGTIEQWGRAYIAPNRSTVVTLPIAFPNEFWDVYVSGTSDTDLNSQDNWPGPRLPTELGRFTVFSPDGQGNEVMFRAWGR